MLYDPKWEQQTKADPFKLETLIAWLEKQPEGAIYNYNCNGHCLLAQYFTAQGFKHVHMYTTGFFHGQPVPGWMGEPEARAHGCHTPMPATFDKVASWGDRTFGAALDRARALQNL